MGAVVDGEEWARSSMWRSCNRGSWGKELGIVVYCVTCICCFTIFVVLIDNYVLLRSTNKREGSKGGEEKPLLPRSPSVVSICTLSSTIPTPAPISRPSWWNRGSAQRHLKTPYKREHTSFVLPPVHSGRSANWQCC